MFNEKIMFDLIVGYIGAISMKLYYKAQVQVRTMTTSDDYNKLYHLQR
jgi:hypothetical protein